MQSFRDLSDLKKWEVNHYIRAHEAVQHISKLPEIVRESALDRAAASIREALSVYLASGVAVDYAEDDRDILTAIGFRPDRASRTDNQVKYSPEQSLIFLRRQAELNRKKSP